MLSSAGSNAPASAISLVHSMASRPSLITGRARHVNEDRAEQRKRDADAAQDEIFPRSLDGRVRAVDADHEHGGQRREFDGHPHHADIVGEERQVHREHQDLVHGVVETHGYRRQPAGFDFVADVARAEHAGGEADEGVEHDEDDVEIVDEQKPARLAACTNTSEPPRGKSPAPPGR